MTGSDSASGAADPAGAGSALQALFHRLNNQLGIVLAHAEILEAKAGDEVCRTRAAHVVSGTLAALGTVRELRFRTDPASRAAGSDAS